MAKLEKHIQMVPMRLRTEGLEYNEKKNNDKDSEIEYLTHILIEYYYIICDIIVVYVINIFISKFGVNFCTQE